MTASVFDLIAGRRGHFRLESGHHSALWFDLDPLFAQPRAVTPLVEALAALLRPHDVEAVCGPLLGGAFLAQLVAQTLDVEFWFTQPGSTTRELGALGWKRIEAQEATALYEVRYPLPTAFRERVAGKRAAIVDDVMSAGSALRGTYTELQAHNARPVVAGALLVLGSIGADFLMQQGLAVEAVTREPYDIWLPAHCPLCAAGVPLEGVG